VQIAGRNSVDLNIQQIDHRQIFRPAHAAEGNDRRGGAVVRRVTAQRQRAADGVGVGIMLQQNMDFLAVAEERANAPDFLIFSVSSSCAAQNSAKISASCRWRTNGSSVPLASFAVFLEVNETMERFLSSFTEQAANRRLIADVAHKHDRLIDMMQFELLVSFFFVEIAVAHLAALPSDPARDRFIGHKITHVALFRCDVAHELKQEIVLANGQVLHRGLAGNYRAERNVEARLTPLVFTARHCTS
jgi:hypothetical protein